MISFEEAIKTGQGFVISCGCKTENEGIFNNLRIDRSSLPEGWYAYDIMHGETGGLLLLREFVLVNHIGTFLTKKRVELGKNGTRYLCGRGGYSFL